MLLLNIAGEEVQDIFVALVDTGATYDEVVAALNAQPLKMECGCQSGRQSRKFISPRKMGVSPP